MASPKAKARRSRENYIPSAKQRAEDERLKNEVEHHFDLEKFRKAIKPLVTTRQAPKAG